MLPRPLAIPADQLGPPWLAAFKVTVAEWQRQDSPLLLQEPQKGREHPSTPLYDITGPMSLSLCGTMHHNPELLPPGGTNWSPENHTLRTILPSRWHWD